MAVSVSFFLVYSKAKIKADGLADKPVSIRCQVRFTRSALHWSVAKRLGQNAHRLQLTIPVKALPRLWANGRVKNSHPGAMSINGAIDNIASRAITLHAKYLAVGFPPDDEFIAAILSDKETEDVEHTFFADYEQYIGYLKDRGTTITFLRQHKNLFTILKDFQNVSGFRMEYKALGKTFAAKFIAWCKKNIAPKRRTQNPERTAQRYLKDLRIFLNHAFSEGWTKETTWRQIKPEFRVNPFPTTLSDSEVRALWALTEQDVSDKPRQAKNLLVTRDWFVFATQTGLRWSDWRAECFHLVDFMPAGMNIRFIQEKTDNPLEVPLSLLAIEVLQRNDGAMPQRYCPATTMQHLRLMAAAANIEKHITSHTARRTFCTLQEKAGVPRAVIMRISGHRTEKDYLRYIGVEFQYNAEMMRRANPDWFVVKKSAG